MRTTTTNETCTTCTQPLLVREMGYRRTSADELQWFVTARFCEAGCTHEEGRPTPGQ